jgi:hypothetical protein
MTAKSIVELRSGRWWAAAVAIASVYAAIEVPLRLSLGLAPTGTIAAGDAVVTLFIGIELTRHRPARRQPRAARVAAARVPASRGALL